MLLSNLKQVIKTKIQYALTEYEMACFPDEERRLEEIEGQAFAITEAIWSEIETIIKAPAELLPVLKKLGPVIVRKKGVDEAWTCILCNVEGVTLPLEHTEDCPWYTVEKLTVEDMEITHDE